MKNSLHKMQLAFLHLLPALPLLVSADYHFANSTSRNSTATYDLHIYHSDLQYKLQQEDPKLTIRSSEVDGNKNVYIFNISLINALVEKAMSEIKNVHKPGASIAYEFHQFDVDAKSKTLKVAMDQHIIGQQELLEYLQNRLNNAMKQTK